MKNRYLDSEFGHTQEAEFLARHTFLFIAHARVVGCVSVVQISEAFKLMGPGGAMVRADVSASATAATSTSCAVSAQRVEAAALTPTSGGAGAAAALASPPGVAASGCAGAAVVVARRRVLANELSVADWRCDPAPVPADAGICHIWVHPEQRRKNIATILMDAVRKSLIYNYPIPAHKCAFSTPTDMGRRFAVAYVGSRMSRDSVNGHDTCVLVF